MFPVSGNRVLIQVSHGETWNLDGRAIEPVAYSLLGR